MGCKTGGCGAGPLISLLVTASCSCPSPLASRFVSCCFRNSLEDVAGSGGAGGGFFDFDGTAGGHEEGRGGGCGAVPRPLLFPL